MQLNKKSIARHVILLIIALLIVLVVILAITWNKIIPQIYAHIDTLFV